MKLELVIVLTAIAIGCNKSRESTAAPGDVVSAATELARGQCDELANDALALAAKHMQAGAVLRPFAMARTRQGDVVGVSASSSSDAPQDVVTSLQHALRDGGQRGDYTASVIVTTMKLANGGDALSFELEHQSGYGKTLLMAYKRAADGQITIDEQDALMHRNVVFTSAAPAR